MALLEKYNGDELIVNCSCGCDEGIHLKIDRFHPYYYSFLTYTNGKFYSEQVSGFVKKLKKIWAIIRNKDFYYSDIVMTKEDFVQFAKWINEKVEEYEQ